MVELNARVNTATKPDADDIEEVTPMNRARAFLLLGPTLVAFAIGLIVVMAFGLCASGLALFGAMIFFLFTCLISLAARVVDGSLTRAVPMPWRALLTALTGAMIAVGLIVAFTGVMLPLWILTPFAISSAYCAGLCSMLSGDPGRSSRTSTRFTPVFEPR